ncbi:MAG: hypothetical protein M3O78_00665 [Chloroflexota bacterium]|nr:hypothetical protein [Chloroflexota bacterium]
MSRVTSWPIPIPLAKDRWRLAALVAMRAAVGGIGLWTGSVTPGLLGVLAQAASAVVLLYAAFLAAWLATLRVSVWPGRVEVGWLVRRHRFELERGPITRLRPARRGLGRLLAPFSALGLQLGPARLVGRERLTVIHLSHDAPLIALPTREGRLAIAPANEAEMVTALEAATEAEFIGPHPAATGQTTLDSEGEEE